MEGGRAGRPGIEDELWKRFRAAQSTFFDARSAAMSAKDNQLRERAEAKDQLLAEAEKLLPVTDPKAARAALRSIHQRWDKIGSVARESQERLEGGLKKVDDAVRKAEDVQWRRTNPEALSRARDTIEQIRKTISNLEGQLEQANQKGDEAATPARHVALRPGGPGSPRPRRPSPTSPADSPARPLLLTRPTRCSWTRRPLRH